MKYIATIIALALLGLFFRAPRAQACDPFALGACGVVQQQAVVVQPFGFATSAAFFQPQVRVLAVPSMVAQPGIQINVQAAQRRRGLLGIFGRRGPARRTVVRVRSR